MPNRSVAFLVLLLACREPGDLPPPPPSTTVEAPTSVMGSIVAANVTWGDAIVRGDSAVLASLYASDAVLMTPDGDVTGSAAIVGWLLAARRSLRDSIHGTASGTDKIEVAGDRAYEAGTLSYTLVSARNTSRELTVRYVNFWHLAAGRWRLVRSLRPLP